jgi:uncharacterized protein YidB (DUF937 family)
MTQELTMGLLDDLIGGALSRSLGGAPGGSQGGPLGGTQDGPLGGALGGALGNALPKGGISKPLIIALLALLASGALTRKSPATPGGAPAPGGTTAGGAPMGGAEGGLLGGLGGLLDQFQKGGLGNVVDSWIGKGQNQPVSPHQLSQALDPDALQTLSQQSGLSMQDVLAQLTHVLPGMVDELSPQGRLPQGESEDPRLRELSKLSQSMG